MFIYIYIYSVGLEYSHPFRVSFSEIHVPFFNEYASKIEKVEEILQTFNWERHSKTIPFIRMVNGYELVWYINK